MYGLKKDEFYSVINILKKYSKKIVVAKIFGSRARGDFRINSDVDISIEFRDDALLELKDDFKESDIGYTVDVIDYKKINNLKLKKYIDDEGKIIFLTNEEGKMKKNKNRTFHTYDEATALEVYNLIKVEYACMFREFIGKIDEK